MECIMYAMRNQKSTAELLLVSGAKWRSTRVRVPARPLVCAVQRSRHKCSYLVLEFGDLDLRVLQLLLRLGVLVDFVLTTHPITRTVLNCIHVLCSIPITFQENKRLVIITHSLWHKNKITTVIAVHILPILLTLDRRITLTR